MKTFDLAVKNGLVVDGRRARPFKAHVYVKDGKIAEICGEDYSAAKSIDAGGQVVSPGFIDIHSHSDCSFQQNPTHEGKLAQGVTFELVGQCGSSLVPLNEKNRDSVIKTVGASFGVAFDANAFAGRDFEDYAAEIGRRGISVNLGGLIGHGTLRSYVAGWELRQLTGAETDAMRNLLDALLLQGALGLSLGLIYPPGSFCDTAEIIALVETLAKRDRLLAVHMRNENEGVFGAFDEMIGVAKATGVRLQISHLKLMGESQWGRAEDLLAKLDTARARGVRVHCDQYPFTASSSALTSCFPGSALEGGYAGLVERLKDGAEWEKIKLTGLPELYKRGGPARVVITDTAGALKEYEGLNLNEAAVKMGVPLFEAMRALLIACGGIVGCIYHSMDEADMLRIMRRTDIATASDGTAYAVSQTRGRFHPRSTSTFPRFLRLAREHAMPIEDAVYKITALPAAIMGLGNSIGTLAPGYAADICVFDHEKVTDRADYQWPWLLPEGISCVIVNGEVAFKNKAATRNRPGRFYLMK